MRQNTFTQTKVPPQSQNRYLSAYELYIFFTEYKYYRLIHNAIHYRNRNFQDAGFKQKIISTE